MSATTVQPAAPAIQVPSSDKGIGKIILSPDAPELIEGIRIAPFSLWPDDRGYFLEVLRSGKGLLDGYPRETLQVSAALSYPGTIKAFHFHRHQTDVWVPVQGMFQVALVDLRERSRTFGAKNTLYIGVLRPWQVLIPPGVGHGYKVLGSEPGVLVYATDQFYNPSDEGRVAYDNDQISYDWELQHK
ncbi:MAG TPA: dTDP-4-dehydrorhamnose 3,5-epimerase family protein [Bryobacteraceae bacterium]|nr:dTDP-4-dehydrorhamnose 3,5-epimerase family protein [Bryobacteraceae bacterium]